MSGSGRNRKPAVKVVIINTQYVETDSMSFKSVVQRLTGKDAVVEVQQPPVVVAECDKQTSGAELARTDNSVLLRGLSFKDFDKFLMELPLSIDEMFQMIMD
ncbi:VQ domain-containing protein [Heracleum sosnowskyi]|uniref:VQ domain-containing protein n=1 Tax=Heracleum sosnowskyi TaxID=360622 RepID=A0AAD8MTV2_9APIA|nr:VQ domain-containing protein [Heracleum sosnowskyi]